MYKFANKKGYNTFGKETARSFDRRIVALVRAKEKDGRLSSIGSKAPKKQTRMIAVASVGLILGATSHVLQGSSLVSSRGGEYYDPVYFQSTGIIHQTTAPYTPQLNRVAQRKNRTLKEMVNSMLSYSGLSEGFWGEAIAVVRVIEPKMKNLDEKGIDCIFIGYAEHSKCYRFYVIEPNDYVSVNSIYGQKMLYLMTTRFTVYTLPRGMIYVSSSKIVKMRLTVFDDGPGVHLFLGKAL
ncbi:zinc finger, CCHC-type containing protein [Tanacetum coccineum]